MNDEKELIHAKRWDFYTKNKKALSKGGYYVKVSVSGGSKVLWEVLDDHDVQEGKNKNERTTGV